MSQYVRFYRLDLLTSRYNIFFSDLFLLMYFGNVVLDFYWTFSVGVLC